MKRIGILAMIAVLLLSVCGCSAKNAGAEQKGSNYAQDGSISSEDVRILSQEKIGDELITCYDPTEIYGLPVRQLEEDAVPMMLAGEEPVEALVGQLGEDGIVAIGYASGFREAHTSPSFAYTMTDFSVSELILGEEISSRIRLRECYALTSDDGWSFYRCVTGKCVPLQNEVPVLVMLEWSADHYAPICEPVILSTPTERGRQILEFFRIYE